jgi:two-component system cell cycle response regulator DivK
MKPTVKAIENQHTLSTSASSSWDAQSAPQTSTDTIYASQSSMPRKKRILIVEDNSDYRELLAVLLTRSGYDVAEATSGLEAIDQARATRPNLIIMDLGLPGITGDEATARLKADPSTRDIPVIVNTAFQQGTSLVERAIAGAAQILHKPTNLKGLQEMVRRFII